ncbi:MAG TPA: cell wall-binding repeat-containing protein [Candidatus Limnocylindria bacterium]|nr:cell wall-binding repeat-containing protein [Candidatus Limnocylindria bacterium]
MPVRPRALLGALSFLVLATALALPASARAAGPKVVIIVGPVGSLTQTYIDYANYEAQVAAAAGAQVVKVYSPNATAAAVKTATTGANVIIYHGHGNGFPNPYSSTEDPNSVNGWGLQGPNAKGTHEDSWSNGTLKYYGESWILANIRPAPNFVMIYANACYAPGAGETLPAPTESVAVARVKNYSYPALKLGGTYYATDFWRGAAVLTDLIIRNPGKTFGDIFKAAPGYNASALRNFDHVDLSGAERVWVQKTTDAYLGTNYWYAFAGDPNRAPSGTSGTTTGLTVERWTAADRYGGAAVTSANHFSAGVPVAYVATGLNYPDALAGGVVAGRTGGPVLLVHTDYIPTATANELKRLQPGRIVIFGGPASVSETVAAQLGAYTAGGVTRSPGTDRYSGAAAISAAHFAAGAPVAYVATGTNFPDALAGVSPAIGAGGPILLVKPDAIPGVTGQELKRLRPGRIVILGGPGSVNESVASHLAAYTAGGVTRITGADRYVGAAAISAAHFASASTVFVATGLNFPDALAGGPVAGRLGAPLLLVKTDSVPSSVATELRRLSPTRVIVLGGPGSVSDGVMAHIRSILGG